MKSVSQDIINNWVNGFVNNENESINNVELQEEFNSYKATWDKLKEMQDIEQFDTDMAWSKLYSRIDKPNTGKESGNGKIFGLTKVLAIAASVAILIGLAGFLSYNTYFGNQSIYNSELTAQLVELPDGTEVYLNTNSEIEFERNFYKNGKRQVVLKGEAFFDVARDVNHPFIISAENSFIKVLGTSFNVNAINNNVEVVVKTGKVEVFNTNKSVEHVILLPGDKAIVNQSNTITKSTNNKENYLGWLNRKLVFKAMPLSEVISDLEKTYHCEIEMADTSIASLKITSTFDNDPLDDILKSIALTFDLSIEKERKKYTLVSN